MTRLVMLCVLLTCLPACAGNGGRPEGPAIQCDPDAIRAEESQLWRSFLRAMEGVKDDCYAAAAPINEWLDEHEGGLRMVSEESSRCSVTPTPELDELVNYVILAFPIDCEATTPVHAARRRFEAATGWQTIPIPQ